MFELAIIVVISTSIWVAYDSAANNVTIDDNERSINNGAVAWFLNCAMLWILGFPYYLVRRSLVLQKRRAAGERALPTLSAALEELRQYKQLLDEGVISKEDFEAKKKKLIES